MFFLLEDVFTFEVTTGCNQYILDQLYTIFGWPCTVDYFNYSQPRILSFILKNFAQSHFKSKRFAWLIEQITNGLRKKIHFLTRWKVVDTEYVEEIKSVDLENYDFENRQKNKTLHFLGFCFSQDSDVCEKVKNSRFE